MANPQILAGIMNPAIAEPVAGFQLGEERRNKRLADEQIGSILNETIGGKIGKLAQLDPDLSIKLAETFQIPVGQQDRLNSMVGDVLSSAQILREAGPEAAARFLGEKASFLSELGIDPPQYLEMAQRLASGDPAAGEELLTLAGAFKQMAGGEKEPKVQRSVDLPDGTVVTVLDNNTTSVIAPDGSKVTGKDRTKAIREAKEFGLEQDLKKSGAKAAGEAAIALSKDAFEKLEPIRQSIANIQEGIDLIDQGAETGPIMSRLPSIRANAVKLDNLQRRLGLDVIGQTTFGALSQGELDLALATALPTNLEGPELRQWLINKRDSQNKLADYLSEAAVFLGTPGNTIPKFLEMQKAKGAERPAPAETMTAPDINSLLDKYAPR